MDVVQEVGGMSILIEVLTNEILVFIAAIFLIISTTAGLAYIAKEYGWMPRKSSKRVFIERF